MSARTKHESPADANSPVPNDAPGRPSRDALRFDAAGRIFRNVVDVGPVASEAANSDEYQAWVQVVMHARARATADLERVGARDLTPFDLLRPQGAQFRYELLRFDGKLDGVRRLEAPLFFKDNPSFGITELYEARLVPVDESRLTPVSVVFTELPAALADVARQPYRDWADRDLWVRAAGYYFKTMTVPGEQGNAAGVPVLVGKGVTVLPGPPDAVPGDPTALDRTMRVYEYIRDETPMVRADTPWQEVAAYDRVIAHAARFPAEQIEEHALAGVKFADLFEDVRRDYRLKAVKLEGRLIRVRRMELNNELRAAGVTQLFEGWLVPANEPRGNPVCIVFTEPLAGVEPADRVNRWVSFAGFSFKKLKYESAEPDPDNPARYLKKYAPLLIGKCPIPRRDPDGPTELTWGGFVWAVVAGLALLLVGGGVLTYYFRSGDRKAKEAMDAVRHRNPFDPSPAAPGERGA
jgi:hypothetical protein